MNTAKTWTTRGNQILQLILALALLAGLLTVVAASRLGDQQIIGESLENRLSAPAFYRPSDRPRTGAHESRGLPQPVTNHPTDRP